MQKLSKLVAVTLVAIGLGAIIGGWNNQNNSRKEKDTENLPEPTSRKTITNMAKIENNIDNQRTIETPSDSVMDHPKKPKISGTLEKDTKKIPFGVIDIARAFDSVYQVNFQDKEEQVRILQALNSQFDRNKDQIIKKLKEGPGTYVEMESRLSLISYFGYRMNFDDELTKELLDFAISPAKDSVDNRRTASLIAEKAEIFSLFSRKDLEASLNILSHAEDTRVIENARVLIASIMYEKGDSLAIIQDRIQQIFPDFII